MTGCEVVIVGGGIIGCSIAYSLASTPGFAGHIRVIERDPTYRTCSTAFATGVIRPQFSTPANIRMSLWSLAFIESARERLSTDDHDADVGYQPHGYMILVAPEAAERFRLSHQAQLANGADVLFLEPGEVERRWPAITAAGLAGAYYSGSGAGSFDPWAMLHAFRRKAVSLGVEFVHDEVVDLRVSGCSVREIRLHTGQALPVNILVNSAGARDSARIAGMANVELPVEPRKRTTFHVATREPMPALPMLILPSGIWVRPESGGFLCGLTPPAERDHPTDDFIVDYGQFEQEIWPLLAETVPYFEVAKMTSAYCGHYDFNRLDENAVLGPVPSLPNFYIATGFSGHGVMHSPAAGRVIADLIVKNRYDQIDAGIFRYERILRGEPVIELNVF